MFIKAEYHEGYGRGKGPLLYYWECSMCGKTYTTWNTNGICGLCKDCQVKEQQRRAKEKKEKAERKLYENVVKAIKREKLSFADVPLITVNGEKYYQAKGIEELINSMFDNFKGGKE